MADNETDELMFRIVARGTYSLSRAEARAMNQMSTFEGEKERYFRAAHNLAEEIIARRRRRPAISRTKH
jgi:hypothetical protein